MKEIIDPRQMLPGRPHPMKRFRLLLPLLLLPLLGFSLRAQSDAPSYKAALFVSNRSGPDFDNKIPVLEDLLSSRLSDLGFTVVSREVVVDSLKVFDPAVASAPRPADSLEAKLTDQSSALRLAQNLGVDYIIQASIASLSLRDKHVAAYGVNVTNQETSLLLSYKVLDGVAGGTLLGDTVKVSTKEQQAAGAQIDRSGLVDDLLDEAAQKVVAGLGQRLARKPLTAPAAKAAFVSINLKVEAADLMVPDVRIGDENTVTISESKYKVSPLAATVEVDGVAVGSAPGTIQLRPGFSKLRLTREGFQPWERTINAVAGQTLTVAMTLSDAAYARWQESTAFMNGLKNGAKLTDAQVKAIEGYAKMLEQSGYKVDTDENIQVIVPATTR